MIRYTFVPLIHNIPSDKSCTVFTKIVYFQQEISSTSPAPLLNSVIAFSLSDCDNTCTKFGIVNKIGKYLSNEGYFTEVKKLELRLFTLHDIYFSVMQQFFLKEFKCRQFGAFGKKTVNGLSDFQEIFTCNQILRNGTTYIYAACKVLKIIN